MPKVRIIYESPSYRGSARGHWWVASPPFYTRRDEATYHRPLGRGSLLLALSADVRSCDAAIAFERYHRFKVIRPGNITFDACASMMAVGLSILKQTDDLAQSVPSMNSFTRRFEGGKLYKVPLHDNNVQYRTVSTGLVEIQPDFTAAGYEDFLNAPGRADPLYPMLKGPASEVAANGCPMSNSVHRTYYIGDVGDYILESQSSFATDGCGNFNIKMLCSDGADTASPADNDPLGFSVDVKTGEITGTPKKVRKGYKMQLRAVDAADRRTDVADWTFDVEDPPAFALNPAAEWNAETNGSLANKYHIGETHLLPSPAVVTAELLQHPASGAYDKVVYLLSATPDARNPRCVVNNTTDGLQATSVSVDVLTGAGAINIQCEGNFTAKLVVRDDAGANVEVRSWRFEALAKDTSRPEHGPNSRGCGEHGEQSDGEQMDQQFICVCDTQYSGDNCDVNKVLTPLHRALIGVAATLLCFAAAYKVHAGKDRRRRIGMARKAAEQSFGATKTELTDGLLAAVEFGELALVPRLIELGADASIRGVSGQLPHADALRHQLQLANHVHLAAMQALFHAHCEFDGQIASFIKPNSDGTESSTHALVEHVVCELARSTWRSPLTGNTVAHSILEGCYKLNLTETQAVQLMQAVLGADAAILTTENNRGKTPTDFAIMCEGMVEIQTRFTVVLFNRYQILRPKNPLYKSPTAEVHECNDLTQLTNSDARYVVKLMANADLWLRELQTRDALGAEAAGSYVGVVSAAFTEQDAVQSAAAGSAGPASTQAAMQYATAVSSVSVFQPSFVSETRRVEARTLMNTYPYAIQMPLADRNLNEIIASERLAEEPLDVIRQSSRKVLNLIQDLHSEGIVHGDVKPKNIVRVDRALMLIDLDMSITVESSAPAAHADPEKFGGSTAYAAPELHQWMAEQRGWGFVSDGGGPLDKLASPQQVDLWGFAVTLYEMATGSPLFQNSYDRATPAALAKLKHWGGLDAEQLGQVKSVHGDAESATLRDVLMWALDAHATSRPRSVAELASHAFFDPRGGAMRENFVVKQIRQLLATPSGSARLDVNVMISYCWGDTDFVLSRLAVEVAPHVRALWLDRLGGEHGMGAFAQASMKRGVRDADVIIAVVSPQYIASTNCGYEMECAHANGKPIIPVVLNIPFEEWPPEQIGQTRMNEQFATAGGDRKIFVDMSAPSKFFQKFQQELLPRLKDYAGGSVPEHALTPQASNALDLTETNAALASDVGGAVAGKPAAAARPTKSTVTLLANTNAREVRGTHGHAHATATAHNTPKGEEKPSTSAAALAPLNGGGHGNARSGGFKSNVQSETFL